MLNKHKFIRTMIAIISNEINVSQDRRANQQNK